MSLPLLFAFEDALPIGTIAMGLIGGLALFLFGLEQMTEALKRVAGERMKTILSRLTTNRFKAAFAGAFVTSVIQSSSVTTVLVVGFASAGLITLQQSIGVIMGANVGTSVTAQIIAFKVTHYALLLVAGGFALLFLDRRDQVKAWGRMIMGLGMIFLGMQTMSDATIPLRTYEPFIDLMARMDNPLTAVLLAATFTALVQSSSATTGVIIVLASQGFISLNAGIALVLGANVGTCVTAMLASIGKPREAVRAAAVHVVFNVLGVLIWLPFVGLLADAVLAISPAAPDLTGTERLAAETPRQIANAHTIFNLANTFIFIGFATPIASLIKRIIPETRVPESRAKTRHLDPVILATPTLALDGVRKELGALGATVGSMLRGALDAVVDGSRQQLRWLEDRDDDVDARYAEIVTYLGRLSKENLSDVQAEQVRDFLAAANYLENIGDTIETNLVAAGDERLARGVEMSEGTLARLGKMHTMVLHTVEDAIRALVDGDRELAARVLAAKGTVAEMAYELEHHLAERLTADAPNRLHAFRLETDVIENLRRVTYFARRIAKIVTTSPE